MSTKTATPRLNPTRARDYLCTRALGFSLVELIVGMSIAVLCIGVQEYPREYKLENPVRDAEAMYNEVNKHSRCRAAILQNPRNTGDIYNTVRKDFLEPLSRNPPEVVALIGV